MARQGYQAWDISGATTTVLGLAEQLSNMYKKDYAMPMNDKATKEKAFAPSHLFYDMFNYYYSSADEGIESPYILEFFREDDKAPYRGYYKKTDVGAHFPDLLTEESYPKVGDKLSYVKADEVPLIQDESAKLPDWHLRDIIDHRMFDFTTNFYDAATYAEFINRSMDAMSESNGLIYKSIVDTFLAQLAGLYSYPKGHMLFRLFTEDDTYTPDEGDSKNARQFYLKDGEIRKRLGEFRKYVKQYYKARVPYLTNLYTLEPMMNPPIRDREIPAFNALSPDLSDKNKKLAYIRECFLEQKQNKYQAVARTHRRQSVICLASAVFNVLRRMVTRDYRNWCGHEWGKDVKANEGYPFRSKPENLLVFMNTEDLNDMMDVYGSDVTPYDSNQPQLGRMREWISKGTRFYGLDFLFPSMAIVIDRISFQLLQYFNQVYDEFSSYHLVKSKISHTMLKLVLFRFVNCNVIELAKGQKFCPPMGWGSEYLPLFIEQ